MVIVVVGPITTLSLSRLPWKCATGLLLKGDFFLFGGLASGLMATALHVAKTLHRLGPLHTTREHGPLTRPVNAGSVYRAPLSTGRVGKKHCRHST